MPKQRKASPASQGPRGKFHFGRRLLLLLAAAAIVVFGFAKWRPHEKQSKFRTLAEIVAAQEGFAIAEEPSRPGPYEELGACDARAGEAAIGSFWANGKNCRYHVPGTEGDALRVIGLQPEDGGGPTYVVLKRKVASRPHG
jgi:hypothetical protein